MSIAENYVAAVQNIILNSGQSSESAVQSASRIDGGGVLIVVSEVSPENRLFGILQKSLPLTNVAISEDLVGQKSCAHVLFPEEAMQRTRAVQLAEVTPLPRALLTGSNVFLSIAGLVFITYLAAAI